MKLLSQKISCVNFNLIIICIIYRLIFQIFAKLIKSNIFDQTLSYKSSPLIF